MTGYGKASADFRGNKITAEVKSLNSKALDIASRVAPVYREKEMALRSLVGQALERGKVDFCLYIEKDDDNVHVVPINRGVAAAYVAEIRALARELGIDEPGAQWMPTLLRLPDIIAKGDGSVADLTAEEWAVAEGVVREATAQLVAFREQEGRALASMFEQKIANIGSLLAQVEPYEQQRVAKIRSRIEDGLRSLPEVQVDRNRLEQEMIYYIEKLDVSEEKQRLSNHLTYFLDTMRDGHGQGKKLGFIAQEMGREINTLGSKSNIAAMQNIVVQMKDELEQIKEQVLNVL